MTVITHGKSGAKRGVGDAFRPIASSLHLPSAHVALIDDSHDRCAALGLSRFESPDLSPISLSELAVMRERNQRLYAHAAPVMEMLFEQIEHTQSMVVLCDATGTVLHAIGDDDFLGRANKVALAPGANWSEASKGTNAVGTALIAEQPTLVHADEHFVHANHFLTCSATPIFDPRGNVLGVLDCSGDQRSYHQHTMALIRMSARMIENHWLSDDYRHVMRLHFHGRVDFIGTLKEGILAVTADGRIAGANHSALELLGQSGAALRMQSLPAVLGVTVSQLVDHFRSPLATPYPVHGANGQRFVLLARFDWPVWHTIAEAAGPAAPFGSALPPSAGAVPTAVVAPPPAPPTPPARAVLAEDPWAPWRTGDAVVHAVIDKLARVIDRRLAVVLHGEVGTGKETLARAVHLASSRSEGPFVSVRCASLPEASIATELFGDARGPGRLAQASGGTLFVSEPADLPAEIQARLLAVLQEGRVTVWGSRQAVPVDFQLVVATRLEPKDLRERMTADHVASALYYRLNGLALRLPPLRERSDLLALARAILAREVCVHGRDGGRNGGRDGGFGDGRNGGRGDGRDPAGDACRAAPAMSLPVEALLSDAAWPGNVRQLENVLRAASMMAGGQTIEAEHLPEDFVEAAAAVPTTAAPADAPVRSLEALEIEAIESALRTCGGNISEASKRLGISRNTIYRRLRWKDQHA